MWNIRPDIEWGKGKACKWIIEKLGWKGNVIYLGDDTTDEDAFQALKDKIIVLVSEKRKKSNAKYFLRQKEVGKFFEKLLKL